MQSAWYRLASYSLQSLIGLLLVAHPCAALDQAASNDDTFMMDEIEVVDQKSVERNPQHTTIKGDALRLEQADTLGKTLENQMGVSNASFGPGVGVPVIRGLSGSRIRIMQDGIGSHDASFLSPDHAVAVEPLFAEEITVVRGSDTIRHGGNAIGGMVNVKDNRIPEHMPEKILGGATETRFDNNGDGTHSGFKLDLGERQFAFRLAGFHRQRNDIEIPNLAINAESVRQQFGLDNVINARGSVPNTDSESRGGSVGFSWLGDAGMAGMAISHLSNQYGIPKATHGLDPSELGGLELILPGIDAGLLNEFSDILGPEALNPSVRIDMQQLCYDFKSEWYPTMPGIDKVAFRYGIIDYRHTEFEGGLPFTTFDNQVSEGRFEVEHAFTENWSGVVGAHWWDRDFSALGVETFVPQTAGDMLGLFTQQKLRAGTFTFDLGLRTERVRIDPTANFLKFPAPPGQTSVFPAVPVPDTLNFRADSIALSTRWDMTPDAALVLSLSRSKRAPDIQELLSLGPHLSTRTFEIGNLELKNETANLIDLGLDWLSDRLAANINGYYNWTANYIYQKRNPGVLYSYHEGQFYSDCVSLVDCLPIYGYSQRNAVFVGYEAEAQATLAETAFGALKFTLFSDWVVGRFADGDRDDVPRLPPLRFGSEISFGDGNWQTAIRYTRGEAQDRPGNGEIPTKGYHLLSASADYHWKYLQPADIWLFAKANNLLNQEVRNSVSFLRDFSPEPGRSLVFGFKVSY